MQSKRVVHTGIHFHYMRHKPDIINVHVVALNSDSNIIESKVQDIPIAQAKRIATLLLRCGGYVTIISDTIMYITITQLGDNSTQRAKDFLTWFNRRNMLTLHYPMPKKIYVRRSVKHIGALEIGKQVQRLAVNASKWGKIFIRYDRHNVAQSVIRAMVLQ